jgi:hypothetical protein
VGLGPTCRFAPRCELREAACDTWSTELLDVGHGPPAQHPGDAEHTSRCRRALELSPNPPPHAANEGEQS